MELSKLEMLGGLILEAKRMEKESLIEFDMRDRLRVEMNNADKQGFILREESSEIMNRADKLADEIFEETSQVSPKQRQIIVQLYKEG